MQDEAGDRGQALTHVGVQMALGRRGMGTIAQVKSGDFSWPGEQDVRAGGAEGAEP